MEGVEQEEPSTNPKWGLQLCGQMAQTRPLSTPRGRCPQTSAHCIFYRFSVSKEDSTYNALVRTTLHSWKEEMQQDQCMYDLQIVVRPEGPTWEPTESGGLQAILWYWRRRPGSLPIGGKCTGEAGWPGAIWCKGLIDTRVFTEFPA